MLQRVTHVYVYKLHVWAVTSCALQQMLKLLTGAQGVGFVNLPVHLSLFFEARLADAG